MCWLLWSLIEPIVLLHTFLPMLPPFSMLVSLPRTQHSGLVPGAKPVVAASNVPAPTPDDWQEARVQGVMEHGSAKGMEGDSDCVESQLVSRQTSPIFLGSQKGFA